MIEITRTKYAHTDLELAKFAKAISHPARVTILSLLLQKQNCICGDLVDLLPLSQSTVSQHLKELKEAGLIKGVIEGVSTCYCINQAEWVNATKLLADFFNQDVPLTSTCC